MKSFFASPEFGMIGLIFFFVFFCAALIWTCRPGAKKQYDAHAQIPIEDKD